MKSMDEERYWQQRTELEYEKMRKIEEFCWFMRERTYSLLDFSM